MPIVIKNLEGNPHVIINKLERRYTLSEADFEALQQHIGEPIEVQSIDYLKDGDIFCVTIFVPGNIASYTAILYERNEVDLTFVMK